jgi:hypothetical protein
MSSGTLVVALRIRDAILVATDSREVRIDPTGRTIGARDDKCKMFEQDGVVFALAGIAHSTAEFDAMALARQVIKPRASLKEMAVAFQRVARPAIQKELRRWKAAPGETAEGIPGLHYLFAKSEGGVSSAAWGGIAGFRDAEGLIVARVNEDGAWPGMKENVLVFGKTNAVTRELLNGPIGFRTEADAAFVALEMMRIASADPNDGVYVGGPTDVVLIRSDGIVWSRQKPPCKTSVVRRKCLYIRSTRAYAVEHESTCRAGGVES